MGLSPIKGHRLMMGRCLSPQTRAEPAGMGLSRCSVPRASCQGNKGNKGSAGRSGGATSSSHCWQHQPGPGDLLPWCPVGTGMGHSPGAAGRMGMLGMWLCMLFVPTKAGTWRGELAQNFTGERILSLPSLLFLSWII